jgi:glycosyltransferase involved in cell wall biosynthesis
MPVSLSIIIPTRNRADLWRSGWCLDTITRQSSPPDEVVIALDHTKDDTADAIKTRARKTHPQFPIKILDVITPRPKPYPASGIPDNCLFHAATGAVLLHLDDDIAIPPDFCRHVRALFDGTPEAAIWFLMTFVDQDHKALPSGEDWRIPIIDRQHWPKLPGSLVQPPPLSWTFTGAIFAVASSCIRRIGGHALESCGYHNQDTRLGNRLARRYPSYLCTSPSCIADHLGTTWHMQHINDRAALTKAYGPTHDAPIANGGPAFWSGPWPASAYTVL